MNWGQIVILDSELGAKISEFWDVELLAVIRHQSFRDSKPTNYGPPNEVAYLLLGDLCQWLGLCPFGEVVHSYNGEFALTSSNGQGAEYV